MDFEDRQVFYRYLDTVNIVPAYAFTVHKSQGSEYENVAVFLESQPKLNTNNLLYTGITRAKKNIKVYVPDEKVLSTMINCVPEPVSNITLNNVFDLVNGILDIKKHLQWAEDVQKCRFFNGLKNHKTEMIVKESNCIIYVICSMVYLI